MLFFHLISASFLKTNTGTDYASDKKKSIFDSTPAVLVEQFTMFDDNKNNNHDSINMLKDRHHIKTNLESDVNNHTKNIDHALFTCGNFINNRKYNKYTYFLYIFLRKNPRAKFSLCRALIPFVR